MKRTGAYRHSLLTRLTHGVFSVAFLGLLVTGFQIYFRAHWLPANVFALHRYFGLAMIASGLVYFSGMIANGTLGKIVFGARDAAGLAPMAAYYLRLRSHPPSHDGYNPLQKLAYTIVLLTLGPMMAATGLALWPHLAAFRPLARFFGGRNQVTLWHVGFGLELVLFFIGHTIMVATTGWRKNVHAIITGWYFTTPAVRERRNRAQPVPAAVRVPVARS